MPNKYYIKGRRKEYKLCCRARAEGCLAFRSAGSHSPIDVCVINRDDKIITFYQSKPDDFPESSKKRIKDLFQDLNGMFLVKFEVV